MSSCFFLHISIEEPSFIKEKRIQLATDALQVAKDKQAEEIHTHGGDLAIPNIKVRQKMSSNASHPL
jgi:hypothetical protein